MEGVVAIVVGLCIVGVSSIALLPAVSEWQARSAARWHLSSSEDLEDVGRLIGWFGVALGLAIAVLGLVALGRDAVRLVTGSTRPWLAGVGVVLLAVVVVYVGTALFERLAPHPAKRAYQRTANRFYRLVLGVGPGWAVIETTGRRSRRPRRVPVGGRLVDRSYWLVAGDGYRSAFVRNIEADPRVRIKLAGRWRSGTAHLLPDDDAVRRLWRLNPVNSLFVRIASAPEHLLTVRIDLDDG